MKRRLSRRSKWLIALGVFAVAILALVLSFDAIVTWRTRKGLDSIDGYTSTFKDVELRPFKLTYALTGLKVMKESAGGSEEPFFYADEIEASLYWKELLDGHMVSRVRIEGPKLTLIAAKDKKEQQLEPEDPNLAQKLDALIPIKVDRIEIKDAEVNFVDKTEPDFPEIWLHDTDVTVENFATRAALAKGEPTIVAASGTLQKSGEVSLYVTADPLAQGISFSGSFKVQNLDLRELGKLISSKSGLVLQKGTLDLFAQFDARDGHISGGVKPLIKNAEVSQGEPGLVNKLKAVMADASLELFSDRVGERDAVATVIPLDGQLEDPEVQLWPTVFGVLRNAFVEGVSESFARLPPPTAEKKEGIVTQARRALSKDRDPPKAQPTEGQQQGVEVKK